jgi:hypothetical protein
MYTYFDPTDYENRWFEVTPAHSGLYPYCPFAIEMYKGLSNGCVNFVETGTGGGGGIFHAMKVGFKNYYSVDIDSKFYNDAMYVFEEYDNVHLENQQSYDALEIWLKDIDEKCLFWLDAHPNNPNETSIPNQILFAELDVIKSHPFKEHVIMIDNIPEYFMHSLDQIKEKLLEINPNYKIELRTGAEGRPDYVLCAFIEE